MTTLVALSVSFGVLGAIATWLALSPLSGIILIWAVFIAWATFFATGGNTEALKNTIVCGIYGVILAWIAGLIIVGIPLADALTLPIWAGIVVGVTVFLIPLGAHVEWLSTIPATVLGYASAFAYMLMANALTMDALTAASFGNPLIVITVSLVVGAVFGLVSGRLGEVLTKKA
jgi:hypothetical protein